MAPPVPQVTVRQVLSHSAGFTVHGFLGYRRDRVVPTLEHVLLRAPPANSAPVVIDVEPGTQMRYSSGGFSDPAAKQFIAGTASYAAPRPG